MPFWANIEFLKKLLTNTDIKILLDIINWLIYIRFKQKSGSNFFPNTPLPDHYVGLGQGQGPAQWPNLGGQGVVFFCTFEVVNPSIDA